MNRIFLAIPLALLLLASCENAENKNKGAENSDATEENGNPEQPLFEKDGIRVYYFGHSADFPTASLKQKTPSANARIEDGETINFQFEVNNYELGIPTPDAEQKNTARSHHGQHIHNIIDNEPYTAHYTDTFSKMLPQGDHISVSFLSRSYHESVKSPDAWQVSYISVGKDVREVKEIAEGPMLIYSRPKGDYAGPEETKRILLDWYLINADLGKDGYKVKATINGTEFLFDNWKSYAVEGLPMGENTFTLELLDASGNRVNAPYTPVTRKIMLKEEKAN